MSLSPNYVTPRGLRLLQEELTELFNVERPKVVETVAWAASNGDRSENGDYLYGKKRLREIDRRLRYLTKRIEAAQVVDPLLHTTKKIVFGATVTYEEETGEQKRIEIVGEDEIDTKVGKISWKSPLAKALLGKEVDQEVLVKRPRGDEYIVVIKIQYLEAK